MTTPATRALVALATLAVACADSKKQRSPYDSPPVLGQVAISPAAPRTADDLTVRWQGWDPENEPLSVAYAWKRNGTVIPGQTGATLPASETTKGDVITAVVEVSDSAGPVGAEASVTILDTPPVVSWSPPASVAYGSALEVPIEASDADGDPVTFSVAYGPAGMTVSAAGVVRWTAALPMFGPTLDVRYGVAVGALDGVPLAATATVADPGRPTPLRRAGLDVPARAGGLRAADLDGDGAVELLVASQGALYELARAGSGYDAVWMYPFRGTASSAASADLDGDGRRELFVSTEDGVLALDGATRRETGRRGVGGARCRDLEAADLDGDGAVELVCLASDAAVYDATGRIVVLEAATLDPLWESAPFAAGFAVALGDVDGDGALEIVSGGGTVHDGGTFALEWQLAEGFGASVSTGDLDGDGVEEIVAAGELALPSGSLPGVLRGFDAVAKTQLFSLDGFDEDEVLAADLDGDGTAEIVLGDGQWGDVSGWRLDAGRATVSELFRVAKQGHGTTALAAADLDGDGAVEVAWGQDPGTTAATIEIAGPGTTWAAEWSTPVLLSGPFAFGGAARLGGAEALLFATLRTNTYYGPSRFLALEPATGAVRVAGDAGSGFQGGGVVAADVDGDGVDEASAIAAPFVDTYLFSVDLLADRVDWSSPVLARPDYGWGAGITAADVNLDGTPDLVAFPSELLVYDVRNGALLWTSAGLSRGVDVAAVDLTGNPTPELVAVRNVRPAATTYAEVSVLAWGADGYAPVATRAIETTLGAVDLAIADCDGDGAKEIYVVTDELDRAMVHRLDAALDPLGAFPVAGGATAVTPEDLPGARNLVASTASGALAAYDARTGAEVWRSPPFPGTMGAPPNGLAYLDVDGDGDRELVFATGGGMFVTR